MEKKKREIHQSDLDMLIKCGVQWEFYKTIGPVAPGVVQVRGTAYHKPVEQNLRHKISTGQLLTAEEIRDLAASSFNAEVQASPPRLTKDERAVGEKKVLGQAKDMVVRLAGAHAEQLAPKLHPTHVEWPFVIDVGDSGIALAGRMDLRTSQQITKPEHLEKGFPEVHWVEVRDNKSAVKVASQVDVDESIQLTMYATAEKVIHGKYPHRVTLDCAVDYKKGPEVRVIDSWRDEEDTKRLLRRVERSVATIDAGLFLPARPTDWWCSEKWCGYWDRCPFGARGRSRPPE